MRLPRLRQIDRGSSAALVVLGSVACLLTAGLRPARAQTAADLFDVNTIQEIRLSINSRDFAELRARYAENVFFPADLTWRGTKVRNVALRSRGSGSRNPTKLGLLLEFDRYTTGQTFVGLSSLVLDNAWQDPSFIREQIAMAFFNRMGQPAPRESFCRLYINNVFQGLYVIIENIDSKFLSRALNDTTGYLYEYHWQFHWDMSDLGDELPAYQPLFEPRTHTLESEPTLYSPIRDLVREINGPPDAVWRDRVSQYLDLDQFITSVAIEVFLAEYDGLTGNWGMNNFYLFRPAATARHLIVPWDRDYAMIGQIDSSIVLRLDEYVFFQRAFSFSDLRARYFDVLEKCASIAAEDGWFESAVGQSATLIADLAHQDTRKQFTNDEFDSEIDFLKGFARSRSAYVLQEVAKARLSIER